MWVSAALRRGIRPRTAEESYYRLARVHGCTRFCGAYAFEEKISRVASTAPEWTVYSNTDGAAFIDANRHSGAVILLYNGLGPQNGLISMSIRNRNPDISRDCGRRRWTSR
ncbi:hypothetical protein EVAR_50684_1 [Eumeta japonica]|uniref:Uncharacterized protein n=1 Tax=Eumeta variegata TaxID=151549 RepID=A0A4C1XPC9_EUMVA|nr:hypothetical protein EVAR_50684_1 [Eumeta japonica]